MPPRQSWCVLVPNVAMVPVSVAGERVEEVDELTYLGSIVRKTGGTDDDIQVRIGKARQAFAMLRLIW